MSDSTTTTLTLEQFQIGIVQPYLDKPGLREKARAKVQAILDQFKHRRYEEWFEADRPNEDSLDRIKLIAVKCMVTEILKPGETSAFRLVEGVTPPYLPLLED